MVSRVVIGMMMMMMVTPQISQTADPTVTTQLGNIKGRQRTVKFNGKDSIITQFLGIPFAEPPVGDLRFQRPVPHRKFDHTFDATEYGLSCSQGSMRSEVSLMKPVNKTGEDCLHLNIFVPRIEGPKKHPTMLFIHGGSFVAGTSETYDGGILASYGNVLVVTINYRLGPFGFLSTGDEEVPGNAGLWDQHLAIQWVKDNIASFGGDDSRITVFGESAGGSSVTFQTLYPGNKGLFHNAIAESGAASAFWATVQPTDAFENAKKFVEKFDCDTSNSKTILKCLQDIKNDTEIAEVSIKSLDVKWTPVLDDKFIRSKTLASLKSNDAQNVFQDYNMIIGSNGFDGHLFMITIYAFITAHIKQSPTSMFPKIFRSLLETQMKPFAADERSLNDAVEGALFAYTNAENPNDMNFNLKQVCDFITDSLFFIPALQDTMNHALKNNKTKTYQYEFNHEFPWKPSGNEWLQGATHAGELPYVFGFPTSMSVVSPQIAQLGQPFSNIVMDYWTNFAKTGDPNKPRTVPGIWKEFTNENRDYLYFPQTGSPEQKHHLNGRRAAFFLTYLPNLLQSDNTALSSADCASSANIHTKGLLNICIVLLTSTLLTFIK